MATPASAQTQCGSGGICGIVFYDANGNGIQDAGETGIDGAVVNVTNPDGTQTVLATNSDGYYNFLATPDATYAIAVQIPPGAQPTNGVVCQNDSTSVCASVTLGSTADFGFSQTTVYPNPGTGTPGYWKNHPEAWTVSSITVGGQSYTRDQAIYWLGNVGKDKRTTMFSSLVPAMLNVLLGNDPRCVQDAITAANAWMATYGPLGTGKSVAASSAAWKVGEPLHQTMDNYNNGGLCAPHRD